MLRTSLVVFIKIGFSSNLNSFNIMFKGWLQKGDWLDACKVFVEMFA